MELPDWKEANEILERQFGREMRCDLPGSGTGVRLGDEYLSPQELAGRLKHAAGLFASDRPPDFLPMKPLGDGREETMRMIRAARYSAFQVPIEQPEKPSIPKTTPPPHPEC